MKRVSKIFSILILLFFLLFTACTPQSSSSFTKLKDALETTINEIEEDYDLNNVTEDIKFKDYENSLYQYVWESSNEIVITNEGKVSRQIRNSEVLIAVRIYLDDVYYQDDFICVVPRRDTDLYTYDIVNTKSFLTIDKLNEVEENLPYYDYLDVVAYIYYFHKLPNNYLTKSDAKKLGWKGSGNVWVTDALQGKCIGGDTFKNYEGNLPATDSNTYIEVDVNYNGGGRGTTRIVYNRYTFDIYYTSDHYNTFTYMIGVLQ